MDKLIPQHKRMAMGQSKVGFAKGGSVSGNRGQSTLKTGTPDTPLEKAKRANGIKGMKDGGGTKC